jgi:hypothetical protein
MELEMDIQSGKVTNSGNTATGGNETRPVNAYVNFMIKYYGESDDRDWEYLQEFE